MSKEIIEKLESIEWFCVGYKTYSCFVCKQLEENGHTEDCALGQAIAARKAEPKVNLWFVKDYLKSALNRWGLDDAKYWVEQALEELEPCETCGGSRKICGGCGKSINDIRPYRGQHWTGGEYGGWILCGDIIPCPDCQQLKAGEFTEEKAIELMSKAFTEYRQAYRPSEGENGVKLLYPRNKYSNIIAYMVSKIWPLIDSLEAEAEAGRRLWLDAQKRCKAQAVRGDKLQAEIKQLIQALELAKIMIDRRQAKLAATRLNRNEFFDETVKLQAELDKAKERIEENRWIPVSERLPKLKDRHKGKLDDGTVDVFGRDGTIVFVANFFPKMQIWNGLEPVEWKPIVLP